MQVMNVRIEKYGLRWQSDAATPLFARSRSIRKRRGASFPAALQNRAFTLIELILVLALLVIITSLAAPAMANFIRGRALDSEARRLVALMHAGQSRAVSEGMPMVLWVDEKQGAYGLEAETTEQDRRPEGGKFDGGFDIANRGAEHRFGHADDVQQFAGHPIFGGRHGGRKQSADVAVDGFRRRFALADRNAQPHGL